MTDRRDSFSYRGITLASISYKLFCNILSEGPTQCVDYTIFVNEQNWFRQNLSTIIDKLSSFFITNIMDVEKKSLLVNLLFVPMNRNIRTRLNGLGVNYCTTVLYSIFIQMYYGQLD